jgi:hypothetical protein
MSHQCLASAQFLRKIRQLIDTAQVLKNQSSHTLHCFAALCHEVRAGGGSSEFIDTDFQALKTMVSGTSMIKEHSSC